MIICLDLGTTVGFACANRKGGRFSGSRHLKPGKHENWAARFAKFSEMLDQFATVEEVDAVFYEEVRRHNGTDAAHVYGGFIGALGSWCDARGVAMTGVPVGTIKKFATGKGNCGKNAMIAAALEKWGVPVADDNEADAVALRELVMSGEMGDR